MPATLIRKPTPKGVLCNALLGCLLFPMNLNEYQIRLLLNSLPRDRDGLPIIPCETYKTTDGLKCHPRFLIDFGVSVLQENRFRQCTPQDVVLANDMMSDAPSGSTAFTTPPHA